MTLSANLRLLMKSHRLTVHQLAMKANLTATAIEAILSGESEGTTRQRVSLARTFNLELEEMDPATPAPTIDAHPDFIAIRNQLAQWPNVARDRFLAGMLTAAKKADHGLISVAKDYQMRAERSGSAIESGEQNSIRQLTAKRGYRR